MLPRQRPASAVCVGNTAGEASQCPFSMTKQLDSHLSVESAELNLQDVFTPENDKQGTLSVQAPSERLGGTVSHAAAEARALRCTYASKSQPPKQPQLRPLTSSLPARPAALPAHPDTHTQLSLVSSDTQNRQARPRPMAAASLYNLPNLPDLLLKDSSSQRETPQDTPQPGPTPQAASPLASCINVVESAPKSTPPFPLCVDSASCVDSTISHQSSYVAAGFGRGPGEREGPSLRTPSPPIPPCPSTTHRTDPSRRISSHPIPSHPIPSHPSYPILIQPPYPTHSECHVQCS